MSTFNITDTLVREFTKILQETYKKTFGSLHHEYSEIIVWAVQLAIETIAQSDALYHNVEHTIFVTLVGQEILRGKHIRCGGVTPKDWLHFIISLLCHDIGYVRGICRQDRPKENKYATGIGDEIVQIPEGSTDAALTPYHVDRGKLFIRERFGHVSLLDVTVIQRNIELTRFPVPNDSDHAETDTFPGLLRAADLLGQMSDPRYLQKIPALYHEFAETGATKKFGYKNPDDLRKNYANFYWKGVYPYVQDALEYLNATQNGRQYVANLYSNLFKVEHKL